MAAAEHLKLSSLELQHDGACLPLLPSGGSPGLLRQFANGRLGIDQGYVCGKGVFGRNGLDEAIRHDRAVVHSASKLKQTLSVTAEQGLKHWQILRSQVAHLQNARARKRSLRDPADSRDPADRKRLEKGLDLLRLNHEKPVRLALVGRNLGQELVWRDPGRGRKVKLFPDVLPDRLSHFGCRSQAHFVFRHVEVGLVQRERFDVIRIAKEDLPDGVRDRLSAGSRAEQRQPQDRVVPLSGQA